MIYETPFWIVQLPERTERGGLITASDQAVQAMHSCNSWLRLIFRSVTEFLSPSYCNKITCILNFLLNENPFRIRGFFLLQ